jgi:hypothetical protein
LNRSFLGQVPIVGLAIVLVAVYLPKPPSEPESPASLGESTRKKRKWSRIDFKGSFIFAGMVLALLLPIELGGAKLPWTHPIILSLLTLSGILLYLFIFVERREEEPILPLEIFHRRDAVLSFLIMGLQMAAQISVNLRLSPEIVDDKRSDLSFAVDVLCTTVLSSHREYVQY